MGIAKSALKLLLEEAKTRGFKDKSILQLGRQHTFLTLEQVQKLAKRANFSLYPTEIRLSFNESLKEAQCVDDVTLFALLGFSKIHSLDASVYENSTLIHDLNTPIPLSLHGQYDVIFDGGTLEHVFDVPEVFRNIHKLLKPGGIVIHVSPSHNHVDHGFYMFSPTLFYDYYSTNAYDILTSYVFEYASPDNASWDIFKYQPGCLDSLSFGGFGKKMLGIWFVAQKNSHSTEGIIPQQGAYLKTWQKKELPINQASAFRKWLKSLQILRMLVSYVRRKRARFIEKRKLNKIRV